MPTAVWIANSHRWVYEKLFEHAEAPPPQVRFVETRREAELIVYLEPPWPDADAPDPLRSLGPRDRARTFVYSQLDFPVRWAPGAYASLPRSHAGPSFSGAFYLAHHHRTPGGLGDDLDAARQIAPELLWSFVGTAENASVRQQLLELSDDRSVARDTKRFSDVVRWKWAEDHREEGRRAFSDYAASLGGAQFVVCPRGRGASSIRLFEALQVGRCPVIISDEWLPPALVDWSSCSLQIPEADVARLPELLREREADAALLGANARQVWEQLFSPERQLHTLVQTCLELARRTSLPTRLAIAATAPVRPFGPLRGRQALRQGARRIAHLRQGRADNLSD